VVIGRRCEAMTIGGLLMVIVAIAVVTLLVGEAR
jgi:hypothetical protein